MLDIGYLGALLGGVATIVSPCSVMLLPAFFAYAFSGRAALLGRTGLFHLGLITTLVPLGAAAGSLGALFNAHRSTFIAVAAVLIIVLGLVQALGIVVPLPAAARSGGDPTSALSVYVLGTVYGIAGTCAGPILGSVLTVAAMGGDAVRGGLLLAIFAVGMVVPLVVLALVWDALDLGRRSSLKPRPVVVGPISTTVGNIVSGLLFVGLGILFWATEGLSSLGGILGAAEQQDLETRILAGDGAGWTDIAVVVVLFAVAGLLVWASTRFAARRGEGRAGGPPARRHSPS